MTDKTHWTRYFGFLDYLRTSGVTNMYGAGEYLVSEFGISKAEAKTVLVAWMTTFGNGNESVETRLRKVK